MPSIGTSGGGVSTSTVEDIANIEWDATIGSSGADHTTLSAAVSAGNTNILVTA